MDHFGVVEQVPRRDENRGHRRDHAAGAPADLAGGDVGEVERWGDKVGDNVDADRGGHKGKGAQQDSHIVVDARHSGDRVMEHFAEHRQGPGNNHHGDQENARKFTGSPRNCPGARQTCSGSNG